MTVNIGGELSVFTGVIESDVIGLVYDGTDIKLYKDGFLSDTQANAGSVSTIASTIYLGSDETSANSINAYLSKVEFWQEELTASEMRTITGI